MSRTQYCTMLQHTVGPQGSFIWRFNQSQVENIFLKTAFILSMYTFLSAHLSFNNTTEQFTRWVLEKKRQKPEVCVMEMLDWWSGRHLWVGDIWGKTRYSLDLECSPKALVLKAWCYQKVEGLVGGSQVMGSPWREQWDPGLFLSFPSQPLSEQASSTTCSHHYVLSHYRPKSNWTNWLEMEINLSSF
jgi:hypothetical protein